MKWTNEQLSLVIKFHSLGKTKSQISQLTGRTSKSISLKLNRLGYHFTQCVDRLNVKCLNCKKQLITTIKENRQFCNKSCSASHTNTFTKVKIKNKCLDCNAEIARTMVRCKICGAKNQQHKRDLRVIDGTSKIAGCKSYILRTRGHRCEDCQLTEWMTKPVPLELEHVDGNSENNDLKNLKLLCCNCHALTSTYKGRNIGNGRHFRRVRYAEGKSF